MFLQRRMLSSEDAAPLAATVGEAGSAVLDARSHLDLLRKDVRHARVVAPDQVPADLVTLNSRVTLTDSTTGETRTVTLVAAEAADRWGHRISVLSPLGTALLGARVGEEICWIDDDGPRAARISTMLFQPEHARREAGK